MENDNQLKVDHNDGDVSIRSGSSYGTPEESPLADTQTTKYTSMFWNRRLSETQYQILFLTIFFVTGMTGGFFDNISLELQENHGSYEDQYYLNLTKAPSFIKLLLAPMIDLFYSNKFGRCKSWVVSSIFLIGITFLYYAIQDVRAAPSNVPSLFILWTILKTLSVVLTISADIFIVKAFYGEDKKGKNAGLEVLGESLGKFCGLNLYVPLSDKEWLNQYIFKNHPLSRPIIVQREFLYFQAFLCLLIALIISLYVAEEKEHRVVRARQTFGNFCSTLPKLITKKYVLELLFWSACVKFFMKLSEDSIKLKLIDLGITRTFFVNISTLTFPLQFLGTSLAIKISKKTILLRSHHISNLLSLIFQTFTFLVYLDLESHKNIKRTEVFLMLISIVGKINIFSFGYQGYVNTVAPPELLGTFVTFFMSWKFIIDLVPTSLGLKLVGLNLVDYDVYVEITLALQYVALITLYPLASSLEKLQRKE